MAWRFTGCSTRGAQHIRAELENQDAIAWGKRSLALADGHGSVRCVRAARGAQLAVECTVKWLDAFAEAHAQPPPPDQFMALSTALTQSWLDAVRADLGANPPQALDVGAYGCTLLAMLATEHWLGWLQIGDGDVLIINAEGQVQRPIPTDDRLLGNATTSLSSLHAALDFRGAVCLEPQSVRFCLLATDGYSNSFAQPAGFSQVATDLQAVVHQEGESGLLDALPGWLQETSALGSGDDITAGVAWKGC